MNSKLTKMTGKEKQNHIFQKSKSYEISSTVIYIAEDQEFIIHSITPAKTNAPILQTSSEGLKLIIQTYQMRNKELKMKLGQLQEEISKASLPVR